MPNRVYETAVRGLGDLVSPRVAPRMIDAALAATGRTPDDVSVAAMRKLLLGRISKELKGVLPNDALKAGLEKIAGEIATLRDPYASFARATTSPAAPSLPAAPAASAARPPGARAEKRERRGFSLLRRRRHDAEPDAATDAPRREHDRGDRSKDTPLSDALLDPAMLEGAEAVKRSSVYLPGIDVPRELQPQPPVTPEPREPSVVPVTEPVIEPAFASEPKLARALDDSLSEVAVRLFAEVETVRQIVISRGTRVLQTRGGGVDAERLAPLAVSTRRLLERTGHLHVYSVERAGGVLFLFPVLDGTISVLTYPNVNIGAVLAARAALEEAA